MDPAQRAVLLLGGFPLLGDELSLYAYEQVGAAEICTGGVDEDGDGLVDGADPDCNLDAACTPEICTNATAEDGDGLTDCQDWD